MRRAAHRPGRVSSQSRTPHQGKDNLGDNKPTTLPEMIPIQEPLCPRAQSKEDEYNVCLTAKIAAFVEKEDVISKVQFGMTVAPTIATTLNLYIPDIFLEKVEVSFSQHILFSFY